MATPYPGPQIEVRYDESQNWHRVPAAQCWIGISRTYEPGTFAREQMFPGSMVELTDGKRWMIPAANPMVASCKLPFTEVRDEDGHWTREVKPRYRELSDKALDIAEQMRVQTMAGSASITFDDVDMIRHMFADILAVNYDLTIDEMEALRLFDPATYTDVIMAFVDWPAMCRLMTEMMEVRADMADPFSDTETPHDGSDLPRGGAT
jgi:hypothetical protein